MAEKLTDAQRRYVRGAILEAGRLRGRAEVAQRGLQAALEAGEVEDLDFLSGVVADVKRHAEELSGNMAQVMYGRTTPEPLGYAEMRAEAAQEAALVLALHNKCRACYFVSNDIPHGENGHTLILYPGSMRFDVRAMTIDWKALGFS